MDDALNRDRWLADEIDTADAATNHRVDGVEKRLSQIALIALGILMTTLSTTITLIVSGIAT